VGFAAELAGCFRPPAVRIAALSASCPGFCRAAVPAEMEKVRDAFVHSFSYFKSQL